MDQVAPLSDVFMGVILVVMITVLVLPHQEPAKQQEVTPPGSSVI